VILIAIGRNPVANDPDLPSVLRQAVSSRSAATPIFTGPDEIALCNVLESVQPTEK
jgi:hypothetical protein